MRRGNLLSLPAAKSDFPCYMNHMKPAAKRKAPTRSSARRAPTKRASTKRATTKRAPAKQAAAKRAPVKQASVARAPVKHASVARAPVKHMSAERIPVKRERIRRVASATIPIIASEITVTTHKFRVGESVHLTAGIYVRGGATSVYKVTQLLPSDGDEQQYRIKSESEPHERVAKQSQLERAA